MHSTFTMDFVIISIYMKINMIATSLFENLSFKFIRRCSRIIIPLVNQLKTLVNSLRAKIIVMEIFVAIKTSK